MQEMWVWSLGQEDPLEESITTYSSILAWKILWTEKSGGLQSMGSKRVRHDWAHTHKHLCVSEWPGGLIKNKLMDSIPRFSDSVVVELGWGEGIRNCISYKTPGDSELLIWGPQFEKYSSVSLQLRGYLKISMVFLKSCLLMELLVSGLYFE